MAACGSGRGRERERGREGGERERGRRREGRGGGGAGGGGGRREGGREGRGGGRRGEEGGRRGGEGREGGGGGGGGGGGAGGREGGGGRGGRGGGGGRGAGRAGGGGGRRGGRTKDNPFMFAGPAADQVRYANQPIAVVVAETLEAATEGAALLSPRYDTEPARIGLDAAESFVPPGVGVGNPAEVHRGDVEAGLAAASKRIATTYETAPQYHNAMEPHAIVARWDGDALSIDTPSQGFAMAQGRLAGLFGIRRRRSTSAVRSSAASGPRASSRDRRFSASSRRVQWESRSSWCCAGSKCTARSDTGLRRGRPCAWAPTSTAS